MRIWTAVLALLALSACAAPPPPDAMVRDADTAVRIAKSDLGKITPDNPRGWVSNDLRLGHWWAEYANGEWKVWVNGDVPNCPLYQVFINANTGAKHDETECVTVS